MATTPYREPLEREPWKSAPAFAVRLLQHRLALHSVAEIAEHYEMTEHAVRLHWARLADHLRARSALPIRGQVEMLILAERDGLPLLYLRRSSHDAAAELPEAGRGA